MNKIELGWTFGKVYVWVAWLEWRVGLPFTWKSSSKAQMIKTKNLTSPTYFLLSPFQLSLYPAALLGIVLNRGQVCQGDWLCKDRGRPGLDLLLTPKCWMFSSGNIKCGHPWASPWVPSHLFLSRKSCPLCVAGEKRLIHCCESEFVYCGFQTYL